MTDIDWSAIRQRLAEPFDVALIDFKPGTVNQETGKATAMAYVDARAVAERLDAVLGPEAWSFTWEPIIMEPIPGVKADTRQPDMLGTHCRVVRGTLIIHGVVKQDVGTNSDTEPDKGAVSDALKRCAVLWGIGRDLYDMPHLSMQMEKNNSGKYAWPLRGEVDRLRTLITSHRQRSTPAAPRPTPEPRRAAPTLVPPVAPVNKEERDWEGQDRFPTPPADADASPLTARFIELLQASGSDLAAFNAMRIKDGKRGWTDLTASEQQVVLDVYERRAKQQVPA